MMNFPDRTSTGLATDPDPHPDSGRPDNSSQAEGRPPQRHWYLRRLAAFGLSSLFVSIGVHLLFGVVATFLVVEHFQTKHLNFHATEPPSPHNEVEHKVQLSKKNNVESAPPDLKRITTTDISPISLPDVPDVPPTDTVDPTPISGMGIDGLTGLDSGPGGVPGGPGGDVTLFGSTEGVGLAGYFFDLKQTPDKQPTGMDLPRYYQVLGQYLAGGWDESILDRYYQSKKPLFADRIAISTRPSGEAPKAFQLENEVQPGLWVVHYHGKISVPNGGDFRLMGFADNVLVVRIAGQIVLDAGWNKLTNDAHLYQPLAYAFPSYIGPAQDQGRDAHLRQGVSFHLDASAPADMDVLLGDDGGKCSFFLLVEQEGKNYAGSPPEYPFFQLSAADAPSFSSDEEYPPYSHTPEPWQASEIDDSSAR